MSKTILVTGSSQDFGSSIAKALANEGHGVIAAIEKRDDYQMRIADELRSTPNIEVINMDLTSEKSISDNIRQILLKYGSIDILINSTEVTGIGPLEATSISRIKHILDIGLFSIIRMIQAVLPQMRKNKSGVILNICCGPSLFSLPFLIPQTLSKMGIIAVSEGLQTEITNEGIDCVSVLVENYMPESKGNQFLNADLPEIAEVYGCESQRLIFKLKQSIFECESIEEEYQQSVVYDILNVLNMKKGTRPEAITIYKENEYLISELIAAKAKLKKNWLERIGIKT